MAKAQTFDFSTIDESQLPESARFRNGRVKELSPKQIRARARRASKKAGQSLSDELTLLHKPIEEWDAEELARGRPRASDGTFKGRAPDWIPRAVHEQAMDTFRELIRRDMNVHTIKAMETLNWILSNTDEDERGRPIVPASTKLDCAKFITEQLLGKPKQEVVADISVKLQGILAAATMVPDSSTMPMLEVESWEDDEEDDPRAED